MASWPPLSHPKIQLLIGSARLYTVVIIAKEMKHVTNLKHRYLFIPHNPLICFQSLVHKHSISMITLTPCVYLTLKNYVFKSCLDLRNFQKLATFIETFSYVYVVLNTLQILNTQHQ